MKIRHILRSKDFTDVLKNGRLVRGGMLSLYLKDAPDPGPITVGTIISKKFVPTAVRRNYLKRLIYAYFRDQGHALDQRVRVAVRVTRPLRKTGKSALSSEVARELRLLTEKAGIRG